MATWDGTVLLTTERLLLRTFRLDDLPVYAALNADPEVVEFLGGVPLTAQDSDETAEWAQELHAREGIGLLAMERRTDGLFLGMCGLHHLEEWFPDDIEIAWRLGREHWGHGYATEAATAWLDHAFGPMDLPRVISVSDRPNMRSIAVMRRLGMVLDHEVTLEEDGVTFDALVHSVSAQRWRSRRA
jgi:RimJ/RimL family protein N-acetyltransferase